MGHRLGAWVAGMGVVVAGEFADVWGVRKKIIIIKDCFIIF